MIPPPLPRRISAVRLQGLAPVILLALGACATARTDSATAAVDPCIIERANTDSPDTITIGLAEPVMPANAPLPRNRSERLLFGLMYEPLVRIDCRGNVSPGAVNWRETSEGTLLITPRDGARYWDGTAVDSRDVVAVLEGQSVVLPISAVVRDARTLELRAAEPTDRLSARHLADQAISLTGRGSWSGWPMGTGAYRPHVDEATLRTTLIPANAGLPVIVLNESSGKDARDLIDGGVDLLVTGDAAAVEYADSRADLQTIPLSWDRTYVFISSSARHHGAGAPPLALELASETVREDARVAEPPYWWQEPGRCLADATRGAPPHRTARVVYDARDPTARDIAERMVALTGADDPEGEHSSLTRELGALRSAGWRATAAGMSSEHLAAALGAGDEVGYVLAFDGTPGMGCAAAARQLTPAEWIRPGMIVPLVTTRPFLIMRRGIAEISLDGSGAIRLQPPAGRSRDDG